MNGVWIINGIPAAGKTTTSKALAERFAKAAVISRDDLQAKLMICIKNF
jgi:adenylate kinase family enzyme